MKPDYKLVAKAKYIHTTADLASEIWHEVYKRYYPGKQLDTLVEAINATDSAALATLYTDDGAHEDVPAGVEARGREETAAFVDTALGQIQDVQFTPLTRIIHE